MSKIMDYKGNGLKQIKLATSKTCKYHSFSTQINSYSNVIDITLSLQQLHCQTLTDFIYTLTKNNINSLLVFSLLTIVTVMTH